LILQNTIFIHVGKIRPAPSTPAGMHVTVSAGIV